MFSSIRRLRLSILGAFLLCSIYQGTAQTPDSVVGKALFQEGMNAYGRNDSLFTTKLNEAARYLQHDGPWDIFVRSLNGLNFFYTEVKFNADSSSKYGNLAYQHAIKRLKPGNIDYGTALNGYGNFLTQRGEFERSFDHYSNMLEHKVYDSSRPENEAMIYNNIGGPLKGLGDYEEAFKYYFKALDIFKNIGKGQLLNYADQHNQIAKLYTEIGEIDSATSHYQQAVSLLSPENKKHHSRLINYFNSLAQIAIKKQNYEACMDYLDKTAKLQEITPRLLNTRPKILADYHLAQNDFEKALEYQNQRVEGLNSTFKTRPKHPVRILGIQKQGEILQAKGDYEEAIQKYQLALSILSETVSEEDIFQNPGLHDVLLTFDLIPLLRNKASSLKQLGIQENKADYLSLSIETYSLALKMVSEIRAKYPSNYSRSIISDMNKESIEDGLDLLYYLQSQSKEAGNISAALQFFEQNKASGLFTSLKDLEARKALGLPDSILVKENEITKELAYRRSLLTAEENSKKSDADKIELYQSKIFELEQEQRFFIQKLEKEYPQYYQLKYEQSFPGISDLQPNLAKGQTFLEYFWGKNHIYILALNKEEAILRRVELTPDIHAVFAEFRKKIKDGDQALNQGLELEYFKNLCTESSQLYSWFLDSVLIQFPQTKSLLIVPDGLLNYLPFEALITKEPDSFSEANYMGLSFLLKDYPINYQYSARLFLNARQSNDRSRKAETPILSIAPDYQNTSPFPQDVESLLRTSDTRDGFSPLTHNQEEASYIKNIWKGVSLLGSDASESNFKSQMGKSQILHFAMHAFSDDQDPMNSGLVFNPSNSEQGEDGILYSHEIYTMDFQAELAILSACNTGAGMLSEGEGVMSLARAFAYAGVPSTSMSLWRANDETIAQIMQSFHMYLNEGMAKSAAMQKAKLDFLESSDRTHPYFWAAFLTIGDDSPIDQNNFPLWAYFLIGLLLLSGLYLMLRRNK